MSSGRAPDFDDRRAGIREEGELLRAPEALPLRDQERRLRLARCAEPRLTMVRVSERMFHLNETFWGLVFLGPLVLGTAAMTVDLVLGGSRREPNDELLLAGTWVVSVAAVSLVVFLRKRRIGRAAARVAAFASVSDQVGGRVLHYAGAMEWLNANWAAESTADEIYVTFVESAVAFVLERYPVLIDVEPQGVNGRYVSYPPRALVYVAALVPAAFAGTEQGADLRAALAAEGFELDCVVDAGFLCRAGESARAAFFTDSPALGRLQAVAQRVVDGARLARISPPVEVG